MKVSDYIVSFFEEKGIKHIYGYQGTMIAHFVDSIGKSTKIKNHCVYNEQAAAFAAVGAAKATGNCTVAYATSGPGALNLISGIADAFYDSVPVVFITGQVNTNEYTGIEGLRQQAFQETKVTSIVKDICKYVVFIDSADKIVEELNKAWNIATTGRKGPVVLDIPMNIQRAEIDVYNKKVQEECIDNIDSYVEQILSALHKAKRPLFIFGNGIAKDIDSRNNVKKLLERYRIPVVSTLLGCDLLDSDFELNMGVLGAAYGHRYANLLAYKKADLIISFGASLCRRQIGGNSINFAKDAVIIRIDIDKNELERKLHDEIQIICDVNFIIKVLIDSGCFNNEEWISQCKYIKQCLIKFDNQCSERYPNKVVDIFTKQFNDTIFVTDVGQHMMWMMQSANVHNNKMLFSGGHGAMGFALPAAIGANLETGKKTICITGDGAFQMNIQELQWVFREQIPLCIIIFNNASLGLIRQQQDDFFESYYTGSTSVGGYLPPNFSAIAGAYQIKNYRISSTEELKEVLKKVTFEEPILIEYIMEDKTVAVPKTYFGEEMINQKPYIDTKLLEELLTL